MALRTIPDLDLHLRGLAITLIGHITLGRAPLDEWSAQPRDLYLKTHNTHNRQISIPPETFDPAFPASERPSTHASHLSVIRTDN